MKYWLDITNLPHAVFFEDFIREHSCLVTARRFGYLQELLKKKGIDFTSAGYHGGKNKLEKLRASAERTAKLADIVAGYKIKAAISKHSVEAPRVAFGIGIPCFHFVDNEYAEKQNRLTLALCSRIIVPRALRLEKIIEQGAEKNNIMRINSVLEYSQVKNFEPDEEIVRKLKIENYVLIRPPPFRAAYYEGENPTQDIIDTVRREGYSAVVLPRGEENYSGALNLRNTDTLNLAYFAVATISGGGTMNREAALLGKPAISFYPDPLLGVDRFLISHGVMKHASSVREITEFIPSDEEAEAIARRASRLRRKLEDPFEVLKRELEEFDYDSYTEN
ncbi:MAG TPA: DUF354 domain-containing protein [Euryarchaeota archaeon]|nr:DUF354 domain-containing protein [Euryarchaeota archaeon]